VWFGEEVLHMREAAGHFLRADRVVVVGTSLQVFPAAGLVEFALAGARKFYIDPNAEAAPEGFTVIKGKAEEELPKLFASWK
jgi:NAD-dependent deacetylase